MPLFFQAEDGIRYLTVTGVQTCALPICVAAYRRVAVSRRTRGARRVVQCAHSRRRSPEEQVPAVNYRLEGEVAVLTIANPPVNALSLAVREIGRAHV